MCFHSNAINFASQLQKEDKNRKKIASEESLSLLVEKLSELFYINLAVAILWRDFDIFSYFGAKYKEGTNMQQIIEGVIKRSLLPTHKRELFLLGKIKRHFHLVKVCQQLLLLSFRHFAESGFFVVCLISIIMHYEKNLHQGLINPKALCVRFKFVA